MVVTPGNGSVDESFWVGKRVFLTGHTGFKGAWLSLWLLKMGADVTGFALEPDTDPSLFALAHVQAGMKSRIGDIRDAATLAAEMRAADPEVLFHMAAQPLVRLSYRDPVGTYATNVMGTVHVLNAARECNSLRACVSVTTDKCYENREWPWGYRENEAMGGHDPYSSSKACAEIATAAFRASFFSNDGAAAVASARAGNVFGGGDWAEDRLIPDILRAFESGQHVAVRNPHAIRPWQHVLEPLSGYLVLAQALWRDGVRFAEAWNFGPRDEDARSVEWIVQHMIRLWGGDAGWKRDEGFHPHEAHSLKLDISKARQMLGWRPRWDLAYALQRTIAWNRDVRSGVDARARCLEDIGDYALADYGAPLIG